jgi:hypothetical protein
MCPHGNHRAADGDYHPRQIFGKPLTKKPSRLCFVTIRNEKGEVVDSSLELTDQY